MTIRKDLLIIIGVSLVGVLAVLYVSLNYFLGWFVVLGLVFSVGMYIILDHLLRLQREHQATESNLKRVEQKYQDIFENAVEGMFQSTPDGRFISVNPAMAHIYGYDSPQEMIASIINISDQIYTDPEERDKLMHLLQTKGRIDNFEAYDYRKDGTIIRTSTSARVVRDAAGNILYYEGFLHDITERQQAEEALINSEKRFRALIENGLDNISLLAADGTLLWESPAVIRNLGYPPDAFIGRNTFELMHPDDWDWTRKLFEELVQQPGSRQRGTFRLQHSDGTWRWVEAVVTNLLHEASVEAIVINYRDVTDRKQAEAEIVKLYRAVESSGEVIFLTDREGVITYINPEFTNLYGYTADEVIGKATPRILKSGMLTPKYYEKLWKTILSGQMVRGEWINKAKNGRLIEIEGSSSPIHDNSENIIGFLAIQRDVTERKQAQEKIRRQLERLAAQSEIDHTITSSFDLRLSLTTVLTHVIAQLGVDAAAVLLFNPGLQMLEYAAGRGFHTKAIERTRLRLGEDYAGRAALEGRITYISNLAEQPNGFLRAPLLAGEAFVSYYAVPLVAKGQIKGVLDLFRRTPLEPDEEWFDFLNALADQTAIAIDNAKLFDSLQRSNDELALAYEATIEGWSHALDLRDRETEGHTQRVTEMTLQLARSFGFSEEELAQVRRGALLHDIGKMAVPDSILLKPGPLTDEEWAIMRKHAEYGYELLYPVQYLRPALDIPHYHHEKWDGSGYPRGLRGEQIPLAARIFAVIDVWDALRSDRPYRKRWPDEKVQQHLRSLSGTHLDPKVVGVFLNLLDEQ